MYACHIGTLQTRKHPCCPVMFVSDVCEHESVYCVKRSTECKVKWKSSGWFEYAGEMTQIRASKSQLLRPRTIAWTALDKDRWRRTKPLNYHIPTRLTQFRPSTGKKHDTKTVDLRWNADQWSALYACHVHGERDLTRKLTKMACGGRWNAIYKNTGNTEQGNLRLCKSVKMYAVCTDCCLHRFFWANRLLFVVFPYFLFHYRALD